MSIDLVDRARGGDGQAFGEVVEPFRPELQLHCYRILGSIHDAEDAMQDTLLAAWRALPTFEGRSSMRTWLYRIATNRCLNKLRGETRPMKAEATQMADVELPKATRIGEVLWLEPYPDSLLQNAVNPAPGPDARYESREAISLAFVTALQLLPARQRAVLILRDVLGYRATEVAEMMGTTVESVTSALKRARATLREHVRSKSGSEHVPSPAPRSRAESELVERFTVAFESSDLEGMIDLLTEDVWLAMPPLPYEWQGRDRARQVLAALWEGQAASFRLVPARANGQPALVLYSPDRHGMVMHAVGMLVLTLEGRQISAITRFDNSALSYFGVPRTMPVFAQRLQRSKM